MSDRVSEINTVIENIPDAKLIKPFEQGKFDIEGCISVFVEGLEQALNFDVSISPQYPFKSHDTETIKFSNDDLLEYKHIMGNGSICIHTAHSHVLSEKLGYDIDRLSFRFTLLITILSCRSRQITISRHITINASIAIK